MNQRLALTLEKVEYNTAVQSALLVAITLLAAAMRFFKLGEWSFWIDEAYTYYAAISDYSLMTPLSTRLIGFTLNSMGVNDWTARLVPALIGILSIVLLYFPIRKFFGPVIALISVLLLAISPFHLHWSQNARFYTALLLFYSLAMFAFYYWLETDRMRYLVLSLFLLGLATLERKIALLFVPAVGTYFVALYFFPSFGRPAGFRLRNLLLLATPAVLFGLYMLWESRAVFLSNFIAFPSYPARVLFAVVYDVGLPLFVTAMLGGVYLVLQRSRVGLFTFLSVVTPLIVILLIAPFAKSESRYIFQTLPAWAILGAVAAREVFQQAQKHNRVLAVGLLLLLLADPLSQGVLYYEYQNGNRSDWKGAFAIVRSERTDSDLIVTNRPELGDYYLGADATTDIHLIDFEAVETGAQRVWFVVDDRAGHVTPVIQSWFDEHTRLVGIRDVYMPGKTMAMRVYLFDPAGLSFSPSLQAVSLGLR